MFDYERYFNKYRNDNDLDLKLSFNMPVGYETANGTFDVTSKTVFINAEYLEDAPDYEKAFTLDSHMSLMPIHMLTNRLKRYMENQMACVNFTNSGCRVSQCLTRFMTRYML